MSVKQLLAKAISTQSEDEAIACLRMARKRASGKVDSDTLPADQASWKNAATRWESNAMKARQAAIEWRDSAYAEARLKHEARVERDAERAKNKVVKVACVILFHAFILALIF